MGDTAFSLPEPISLVRVGAGVLKGANAFKIVHFCPKTGQSNPVRRVELDVGIAHCSPKNMKLALLRVTCLFLALLTMSCERANAVELLVAVDAVEKADPVHGWLTVFINANASSTVGASVAFTNEAPGVTVVSLTGGNTEGPLYRVRCEFVGSERSVDSGALKIGRKDGPDELDWKEVFSEENGYEGTEAEVDRGRYWRVVLKPNVAGRESTNKWEEPTPGKPSD